MAGYSKIFCIGHAETYDGIANVRLCILQGEGNRQWFEAGFVAPGLKPLGSLRVVVPARPNDPDGLIDACIAFYPSWFSDCPSLALVSRQLKGQTCLDFDLGRALIPKEWYQLREEARRKFDDLVIYDGHLRSVAAGRSEPWSSQAIPDLLMN